MTSRLSCIGHLMSMLKKDIHSASPVRPSTVEACKQAKTYENKCIENNGTYEPDLNLNGSCLYNVYVIAY